MLQQHFRLQFICCVSAVIPNPGSLANPSLFISTADSWFSGSTVKAGRWYVDDIKLVY